MNSVTQFDNDLSQHDRFWTEVNEIGEVDAFQMAESFGPSDWGAVDSFWRKRSAEWKECFIEVLGRVVPSPAAVWLLEIIHNEEDELAYAASIRILALRREGRIEAPPLTSRAKIRELWASNYAFGEKQLDDILEEVFKAA